MSAPATPTAYFGVDGDEFIPTPLTQGPWGEQLSGTFIGGMLAYAVERAAWDDHLHPTRFTVDLLRPVALAPLRLRTTVVREGKRLKLVDSEIVQSDTVVARASTLLLRTGDQPPGEVWTTPMDLPPRPTPPDEPPAGNSMLFWIIGQDSENPRAGVDFRPWQYAGPKAAWVRELQPLVDGVALTPFTRAALVGPDIGLTAVTHYSHAGIATGVATLFDRLGPIGSAMATGLARPGFAPPVELTRSS